MCTQDNQLIRSGQWWRLITPVALHANVLHLLTNNYSLNRYAARSSSVLQHTAEQVSAWLMFRARLIPVYSRKNTARVAVLQLGTCRGGAQRPATLCLGLCSIRHYWRICQLCLQHEPLCWRIRHALAVMYAKGSVCLRGCCLGSSRFGVEHLQLDSYQCSARSTQDTSLLCKLAGAIFGLGGALAVYCARHRELMGKRGDAVLQSLGQSLLLNMAIGLTSPRVDQWCAD